MTETIALSPSVYLVLIINAVCQGVGSALGAYLATHGIIKKIERLTKSKKKKT